MKGLKKLSHLPLGNLFSEKVPKSQFCFLNGWLVQKAGALESQKNLNGLGLSSFQLSGFSAHSPVMFDYLLKSVHFILTVA